MQIVLEICDLSCVEVNLVDGHYRTCRTKTERKMWICQKNHEREWQRKRLMKE